MNLWLTVAAVNGFLAVGAGAFGAHGLRAHLDAQAMSTFQTAVLYHMFHALAIGIAAVGLRTTASATATFFLAGIVLFCGSLYLLALTGVRAFAFVTPFGGLAFLLGWATLAYSAWKAIP